VILLVDIGNSRVKWAASDGRRLGVQQAAEYARWTAEDWRRRLFAEPGIRRVVAVTVAGETSEDRLREAARAVPGCTVEFIATSASAAGVRNGYREPQLLGADRWVAVIAAHHLAGRACCVVDVGTAATIDAVMADGQHLGGFIVPGPRLMVASLHHGTSDLAERTAASGAGATSGFADNTRDAIERGCVVTLAALADRSAQELALRAGSPPALIFTGGAAQQVLPHVQAPLEWVPDLVLRGLALLAGRGR
jgi:type III pantothenate kinase